MFSCPQNTLVVVQCLVVLSSGVATRLHTVPRDPHRWLLQAVNVDQHPNSLMIATKLGIVFSRSEEANCTIECGVLIFCWLPLSPDP